MNPFSLLISIVPHGRGEKLTRAAMERGCQGGTVLMGRSLAKSNLAAILGLGETSKDLILMVVNNQVKNSVQNAILKATSREKKNFGELFAVPVDSVFKSGGFENSLEINNSEENEMNNDQQMITVIVNKGYADDVMFAARKAGAGGGTVINARGTARETDEQFFGMHIVPEKEMLIIVVPKEKKDDVINSISQLNCLKTPGMGIIYSSAVENFALLGKAN